MMQRMRLILTVLAAAAAVLLLFLYTGRGIDRQQPGVTGDGPGGAFSLVNDLGEPVSDADYRGRYMLIYFGYSWCPDVCPVELLKMGRALDLAEADGVALDRIAPLFITIDPERDTVDMLHRYLVMFHPRITGLTGTPEAIEAVTRAFRIHRRRVPAAESGIDPANGYLMDHSSLILLMGRDGRFLDFFSGRETAEEIAAALKALP